MKLEKQQMRKIMQIMNRTRSNFSWKWKLFWGNQYKVYNNDKNIIYRILVYHKKIYLLDSK